MPNPRPPAITLFVLAFLSLFVMLHHPTIGAHEPGEVLAEIQREQLLNRAVHGAMIVVVLLYHWCFSALGAWLGAAQHLVSLAQLAQHVALASFTGAALVSGFVVPELAARVEADAEGLRTALLTLSATNQALAKLGTLAFGAAIALWGLEAWRCAEPTLRSSVLGVVGVLCGSAMALGQVFGVWSLDVAGMTLVVVLLGAWGCAVAWWLWRRQAPAPVDG